MRLGGLESEIVGRSRIRQPDRGLRLCNEYELIELFSARQRLRGPDGLLEARRSIIAVACALQRRPDAIEGENPPFDSLDGSRFRECAREVAGLGTSDRGGSGTAFAA